MPQKIHNELDEFKVKLIAFLMADKLNVEIENIDSKNNKMTLTLSYKSVEEESKNEKEI